MAAWPAYALVDRDAYGLQQDSDVARTTLEDGAVQQVHRYTEAFDVRKVEAVLKTDADYVRWMAWARQYGHTWFAWRDTEDGVTRQVRIRGGVGAVERVSSVHAGQRIWRLRMELEGLRSATVAAG